MTPLLNSFAHWLADYYLLSSVLLVFTVTALVAIKQPAKRRAVTQSTLVALILLAALCAVPGWSAVHLLSAAPQQQAQANEPPTLRQHANQPGQVVPVASSHVRTPESVASIEQAPSISASPPDWPSVSWPAAIAVVHLGGAAGILVWLSAGLLAGRILRLSATPAPAELAALLAEVAATRRPVSPKLAIPSFGETRLRGVELLLSDRINVPVALGIRGPAILLPTSWLTDFLLPGREEVEEGPPRDQLRSVLAHELTHIRNHDLSWLATSRVLLVFLWAQPLFWFVRRRMRLDQEALADAAAAELTGRQRYAEQLVAWAHAVAARPAMRFSSAVGMWEGPSQLRQRIALLIDERITVLRNCPRRWQLVAVAACTLIAVGLSLVTFEPAQSEPADDEVKPSAAAQTNESTAASSKRDHSNDRTFPITATGRAIDKNGDPIPRAKIYLASPRNTGAPLATSTTDDKGVYKFDDVELAIERQDGKDAHGSFEVFGQAEGYGFAWRPLKWFYSDKLRSTDSPNLIPGYDLPRSFGREDAIDLDIRFGPPAKLRGRVVNDLGEPIANTPVAIRDGEPFANEFVNEGLESFNWPSLVPESIKIRRADKDGRFEFTALPAKHSFRLDLKPPGYTPVIIYAATQAEPSKNDEGLEVFGNDFEVIFERPRKLKLRIVYGDSGQPAPKVGIGGKVTEAGFWETTDDNGIVEVPLPDGKFKLSVMPRYGTPYLRTEVELDVTADTAERTTTIKLHPAAVANINVIDADTLEPISGVDVWIEKHRPNGAPYREIHGYRSWEVETRISHYESPRSDEKGEMRVLFEPGKQRIGVGLKAYPEGYEPVEPDGKVIEVEAGKPRSILFQLRPLGSSRKDELRTPRFQLVQTTKPAVDRTESKRPPTILSYNDGKPDGKKSLGGSGHMIRFEMPKGVTKAKGIRIHSSRYGYPQAPDEDAEITFLSEDLDETLHTEAAPYRAFKRGKESWVRLMFDKEVELPEKFWIALNFNPEQTKGVYVSYDTSTKGEHSRIGLPGEEEEPKKTDFNGDWMVQVMLARPAR
jgi:beta-lactamase regulating signal transducer with metallopeptidase domain